MAAYGLFRALSLDVVLGGLAGGALALYVTGARIPAAWWPVLAAAIWVVYTTDHLLDARRVGAQGAGGRLRLHARHPRRLLVGDLSVAGLCVLGARLYLPHTVFLGGVVLSVVGALHLAASQLGARRWLPKEITVACIYAAGIWLAPGLLAPSRTTWIWLVAALHFLAVLLNMAMYAIFEERLDAAEDGASISRTLSDSALRRGVAALTALGLAAGGIGLWRGPSTFAGAWCVLMVLIAAPCVFLTAPSLVVPHQRYRTCGEILFLLLALPFVLR